MSVNHDESAQEFYIELPEGRALLHYERAGDKLDFHHTFVPPELRGRGLAEEIVIAGFEYAKASGIKVIPTCPYILRFVMKHPEWKPWVVRK